MKNKKLIIVLSVILIVSVVGNILAYAAIDLNKTSPEIVLTEQTAPKTKSFAFKNKTATNLSFKETIHNIIGNDHFSYTDSIGNEYRFDEYNNLRFYLNNDQQLRQEVVSLINSSSYSPEKKILTQEQALTAAKNFVKENWGEAFEEFSVVSSDYFESDGYYYFRFAKKYGKDSFIIGEQCIISIYANGEIKSYSFPNVVPFTDFDASSIENLTFSQISDYVVSIIKENHGDDLVSYQIDDVYLVKRNGKYVLNIQAGIEICTDTLPDGNIVTIAIATEYYYEIEQ